MCAHAREGPVACKRGHAALAVRCPISYGPCRGMLAHLPRLRCEGRWALLAAAAALCAHACSQGGARAQCVATCGRALALAACAREACAPAEGSPAAPAPPAARSRKASKHTWCTVTSAGGAGDAQVVGACRGGAALRAVLGRRRAVHAPAPMGVPPAAAWAASASASAVLPAPGSPHRASTQRGARGGGCCCCCGGGAGACAGSMAAGHRRVPRVRCVFERRRVPRDGEWRAVRAHTDQSGGAAAAWRRSWMGWLPWPLPWWRA